MPRPHRVFPAGLVFHVMNRGAKRAALFEQPDDYRAFETLLAETLPRQEVALFAYCLMPNHWHLLLSPRTADGLSRFMHWLTTTHARRWQSYRGLDGDGAVYQGRFRATAVGGDRHFLTVCRYVERNALRAALVSRAESWPWCSLGRRSAGETPWLAAWPVARPAHWVAHVNEPQTPGELAAIRESLRRGEPYGDGAWAEATARALGRSGRVVGRPVRRLRLSVLFK